MVASAKNTQSGYTRDLAAFLTAEVSRAIITMCTGVAQWNRAEGELTPRELAERYFAMARMTVGAP
ncbi:hypothetical protein AB0I53_23455 [Saccharopolyspora sp. NPDC050389]|uniref:hypothetical protein n=1 Tax=Saccharopolyspora sp. NPDC050389 TaxID=3155516 RepID=UPI0033DFD553